MIMVPPKSGIMDCKSMEKYHDNRYEEVEETLI
jgi:hypothetical protein